MFPELGATELIVVAVVALIVVGPKDLPRLLRKLGQGVAKVRGLANEFKSSFSEMARQSELDDLRREVEALRQTKLDPLGGALSGEVDEIRSHLNDVPKGSLEPWEEGSLYDQPDSEAAADEGVAEAAQAPADPAPAAKPAAKRAKPAAKGEGEPASKAASKPASKAKAPAKAPAPTPAKAASKAKPAAKPKAAAPTAKAPPAKAKPAPKAAAKSGAKTTTAAKKPAARKAEA